MKEFRAKMGENGRIVIPVLFRRELNIEPGEELIMRMEKNELHVISSKQSLKNAQSKVQALAKGVSLVKKLKSLRQEDKSDE